MKNLSKRYIECFSIAAALCIGLAQPAIAGEETANSEKGIWSIEGFIGGTDTPEELEPTVGLGVAYQLNRDWTVGALVEGTNREENSTLYLGELVWHPFDKVRYVAGYGLKDPSGEHEQTIRAGLGYEIKLEDQWFIKPYGGIDFVDKEEEEFVFGIYFGRDL